MHNTINNTANIDRNNIELVIHTMNHFNIIEVPNLRSILEGPTVFSLTTNIQSEINNLRENIFSVLIQQAEQSLLFHQALTNSRYENILSQILQNGQSYNNFDNIFETHSWEENYYQHPQYDQFWSDLLNDIKISGENINNFSAAPAA